MFDMLTRDELYRLHTSLFNGLTRIHQRMRAPDGTALIPVLGDDWLILRAAHDEMRETNRAVFEEIGRRDQEHLCRTCGFTHPEADCPRWPARDQADVNA